MALSTDKNDLITLILRQKRDLFRINSKISFLVDVDSKDKEMISLKLDKKILENKIAMMERLLEELLKK